MPVDSRRKGDIKVLVGATVGVLLVGFFIAGAILVTTRGGNVTQCSSELNIGLASSVRSNLEHGAYFQTGGGYCGFWLALENGDIVAYKAVQPSGCTLKLKFDHWECSGDEISVERLVKYPLSIRTVRGVDRVFVNLAAIPPDETRPAVSTTNASDAS